MYVSPQPDVECQVPTDMVRVVINHHLVVVPIPVVAVVIFIGCDTEIVPVVARNSVRVEIVALTGFGC